ncbi:hypothetical protein EON77_09465 [bacterium]|nr:MAG: hypothetical protein EON77_09465 [bacterium]
MSEQSVREAVNADGIKGIEARFVVDVPPDALVEILWDIRNFGRLFPDIEKVEKVGGSGDSLELAYRINAVVKKFSYVVRRTVDRAARTITWREISGDFKAVRGGFRVEPHEAPGKSRVTYGAFVEVGRFVPTSLVRDVAMRKMDEMIGNVKRAAVALHGAG